MAIRQFHVNFTAKFTIMKTLKKKIHQHTSVLRKTNERFAKEDELPTDNFVWEKPNR